MQDQKELQVRVALEWIVGIMKKHAVPFQLTGGLAAHSYGATRPIHDIDIDIPEDRFPDLLEDVRPFIVEGPSLFKNKVWDIYVMTLEYHGQEIDIGGAFATRIMDEKTGEWHTCRANFDTVEIKSIFGVDVPVISREELIEYKTWLALPGDHQEQDVREISLGNEKA